MALHIASLGSSFAAGPGIKPQIPPKGAGRSGANYAHLLASRLGAKLTDLSVSGATLLNLLDEEQTTSGFPGGQTFRPQITGIPDDVDIVLVLGGGNDTGYIMNFFNDSVQSYWAIRMMTGLWRMTMGSHEPKPDMSVEELAARYGTVLDAIHAKVPKAKVVVVEYLTLLGDDVRPGVDVALDAESVNYHKEVAAKVQRATAKAAYGRASWCERIPVAERSRGHGIGSKEPWVSGFGFDSFGPEPAPLHPNADGMKAVADMLYERLRDFTKRDSKL